MYANFVAPVVVMVLFTHELTGSLVEGSLGISNQNWQLVRLFVVIVLISLKILLFREELQFQFDQSYFIVSRMMADEVEKTELA